MIDKVLDKITEWLNQHQRKSRPALDWVSLVNEIEDIIKEQMVFLDTRENGLVTLDNIGEQEVIGIAVTPAKPGIKAWDTEVPARDIVTKLSERTKNQVVLLLNRNPEQFVGYYAYLQ